MGALQGIRWYVTNLMGDNAYQHYVEHIARAHPGEAVVSEKQYWRDRHAESEAKPGARCC